MQNLVLDTSVIVKWLFADKEEHVEAALAVLRAIQSGTYTAYAPELCKYELGNVLAKRRVETDRREAILSIFYHYPITFVADDKQLASRTAEISFTTGMTYYDASFVALAEELDGELITDNFKHQGKATSIKITSLPNFL